MQLAAPTSCAGCISTRLFGIHVAGGDDLVGADARAEVVAGPAGRQRRGFYDDWHFVRGVHPRRRIQQPLWPDRNLIQNLMKLATHSFIIMQILTAGK